MPFFAKDWWASKVPDIVGKFFLNSPTMVSYWESQEFCEKLTELHRNLGLIDRKLVYRLPAEAEWEYALRAGTQTAYFFGKNLSDVKNYNLKAAYPKNLTSGGKFSPSAGIEKPNPWGLHDMAGSLREYQLDSYRNNELGATALNRSVSVQDPVGIVPEKTKNGYITPSPFYEDELYFPFADCTIRPLAGRSGERGVKKNWLRREGFRLVLGRPIQK